MNPLVCAFFISLLPIWVIIAKRSSATREVLYSGWEPVIIAMAISRWGWPCPQSLPGLIPGWEFSVLWGFTFFCFVLELGLTHGCCSFVFRLKVENGGGSNSSQGYLSLNYPITR